MENKSKILLGNFTTIVIKLQAFSANLELSYICALLLIIFQPVTVETKNRNFHGITSNFTDY